MSEDDTFNVLKNGFLAKYVDFELHNRLIWTQLEGTVHPAQVYQDSAGHIPLPNPFYWTDDIERVFHRNNVIFNITSEIYSEKKWWQIWKR